MSEHEIDVTGIGNAIVDVLANTTDEFLIEHSLTKGTMKLIESEEAESLYAEMGTSVEVSGGSAGNTIAGIGSFGGRGAYVGKVADDELGRVFAEDIRSAGTLFETEPLSGGAPTARCLILVTPDAQRTMNTFLGACVALGPDDIDPELIRRSKVTYMEGYLWDPPNAKAAFIKAAEIAHSAGRKVSLSLSDPFCVQRHRQEFADLVQNHVDVLFANEIEIMQLYQVDSFDQAVAAVKDQCETAALTRSEMGSVILSHGEIIEVGVEPVSQVVDTTGAGDLYAAGFLHGLTRNKTPAEAGRFGALAAAEVISHFGARPERSLQEILEQDSA